ncbi:MAG: BON domain-containing protein [Candidatus Binatia bacterium]
MTGGLRRTGTGAASRHGALAALLVLALAAPVSADSNDELADSSIWRNPYSATDRDVGTIRGAVKDVYTTLRVKMRLIANERTPALSINVDTRGGVVTLFGIVPTEASRSAAERAARKAAGVDSVENQLQVVDRAQRPAVKAKDAILKRNVTKSLGRHSQLGGVDIEVSNCIVRLTGSVPSAFQRGEALDIARATTGVCKVEDGLMIR